MYGRSGVGKTTWWLNLAAFLFQTTGKKTRCYSGDGGSATVEYSGLVEDGVVELFQFTTRPNPFETTSFCCQGKWPADPENPTSPWVNAPSKDGPYGLFVFEGLSVMAQYLMSGSVVGGLAYRRGQGEKTSQMDGAVTFKDGSVKVSHLTMSDYGALQRTMYDRIEETRVLPGMVYWTAHQRDAEDSETKERIIGPDVGGKALTSKIGASFGNTIHLDTAQKRRKERDGTTGKEVDVVDIERRAYTREHYDPDGQNFLKYYANNRCATPDKMPLYLSPPDPVQFYRLLKEGRRSAVSA